jgi:serine/threonine protein kinase
MTWPHRYKIVLGISRGIEYLHEGSQNIILHRDIKPSNVLLDDKFEAKLCDFGLVRQVDQGQRSLGTETMIGSIDYMDPVCMGPSARTVSSASDMYSFGVLLLEVATGRKPATTKNHEERVLNGLTNVVSDSHAKGMSSITPLVSNQHDSVDRMFKRY